MASEKFGITGNGKALLNESDIGDYSSANIESSAQTQIPNHESQTGKETDVVEYKEGIVDIPKETIDAFGGDELRARVFYEKYALRNESGRIVENTPDDMWRRVAREIASPEKTQKLRK